MFDAQNILSISTEQSEKSLKIYHDNKINECQLRNSTRLSVLCPNITYIPKSDTQNIQLPSPLTVLRFSYNQSEVYISEIGYDDYFCMIELNLNDMSCTRIMLHYSEMEMCFIKMLDDSDPKISYMTTNADNDTKIMASLEVFSFVLLSNIVIALVIYVSFIIAFSLNSLRKQRESRAFLRKTYLPIKRDTIIRYKK